MTQTLWKTVYNFLTKLYTIILWLRDSTPSCMIPKRWQCVSAKTSVRICLQQHFRRTSVALCKLTLSEDTAQEREKKGASPWHWYHRQLQLSSVHLPQFTGSVTQRVQILVGVNDIAFILPLTVVCSFFKLINFLKFIFWRVHLKMRQN